MSMLKLGLAQLLVEGGEPERNLERAKKLIEQSSLKGCDMVLLPETIDFGWTHPSALSEAAPIPGKFSSYFCELAIKNNIWICVGLTEKINQLKRYNSAVLINNKGDIVSKYRKINLLTVEFPYYEVGNNLQTIDTPWGKLGLNICADNYLNSLDIGHVLSRMGAQIILAPSSWTVDYSITEEDDPYKDKWLKPLSVLARKNNVVMVNCTSVGYIVGGPYEGKKMVGCSLVVNKEGVLFQGQFNEFAGELSVIDINIPSNNLKGIQIPKLDY